MRSRFPFFLNHQATAIAVACILTSVVIGVPTTAKGQTEELGPDIIDQWTDYFERVGDYEVEFVSRVDIDTGNQEIHARNAITIAFLNPSHTYASLNSESGDESWLVGRNRDYVFELKPVSGERKGWILQSWETVDSGSAAPPTGLSKIIGARFQAMRKFVEPTLGRAFLREIAFDRDSFRVSIKPNDLQKIKQDSSEFFESANVGGAASLKPFDITIVKTFNPAMPYGTTSFEQVILTGWAILDTNRYFLPLNYRLHEKWIDNNGEEQDFGSELTATFSYHDADSGLPVFQKGRFQERHATTGASSSIEVDVNRVDLDCGLTEADFRLPAFGLPEPPEFQRRAWWPYVALALVGLVLIAIALKWNQRRKATG